MSAIICRLQPSVGHGSVCIGRNHQIGIKRQHHCFVAGLIEVCRLIAVIPSWCKPQHGVSCSKVDRTIEIGIVCEQQTVANTIAHHIGIGQAFHSSGVVGIVKTVGIGRSAIQGNGSDVT